MAADEGVLKFVAEQAMQRGKDQLALFQEKLAQDPVQAFSWATTAIEAATRMQVAGDVLRMLAGRPDLGRPGRSQAEVVTRCTEQALYMAEHPNRSSSAMANLVHECTRAAWAEFAREGRGGL